MSLTSQYSNGVVIYNCTPTRIGPQWIEDTINKKLKGSLRYNAEYRSRIELIQDFQFPTSSNVIKLSPNNNYTAVLGVYKPCLKVFDFSQLSLKFERSLDAEGVDVEFLTDDFRKLA